MALTKEDLSQIKGVVGEATKSLPSKQDLDSVIENLARMVAKGFEQTATKTDITGLKSDIARLELEIMEVKERVIYIERDTAEIRKGLISRVELEDIWARLLLVEKKLGIVSGK